MKTKALARVNAIFGLISGIVLLLAPLVIYDSCRGCCSDGGL